MDLGDLRYRIAADTSDLDRARDSMGRFTSSAQDSEKKVGGLSGTTKKFGSDARSASKKASTGMVGFSKKTDDAIKSVFSLRSVIGTIAVAVGGIGLGKVVSDITSFQDTMLGLQAISGATQAQFESLEKQARTLGATTRYSAQQSGEAQRFLAQAGFDVNEVLSATPGILQLATAGQLDLARAADIASNVLGGMRLPVSELARVNDVLASAAASSNTNVEQLGQALSTAAPIAATAGVSIEEAAAAIGALSDAGIQGSRAGTGFLGFIRQLSNITPQAQAVLNSYGLTVADVNVESNGLASVLSKLRDANLSTADAFAIFQSEAGPAAQVLANSADHVADLTTKFGENSGAAQRMAEIIGSGLSDSILGFNSALGESILQLGEGGVGGGFQYLIDKASGVISVYNGMIDEFAESNELSVKQKDSLVDLADAIGIIASTTSSAVAAYVAYRAAVLAATAAQAAFNVATSANPLGVIVTALGAAVGAMYYYREELGLVDVAAQNATDALNLNKSAIEAGSRAALDNSYDALTSSLHDVSLQAQEAILQLQELEARERFYSKSHGGVADSVRGEIESQKALLDSLTERQIALQAAIEENRNRRSSSPDNSSGEALVVTATRLDGATKAISSSTKEMEKAQKAAAQAASKFDDALLKLTDSLYPVQAAQKQYLQDQLLLQNAWVTGRITALEYFDALQKLNEAQMSSQTASQAYGQGFGAQIGSRGQAGSPTDPAANDSEWDAWLESARTAFSDFDNLNKQAAESFTQGFGNALESMVFDFEDLGSAAQGVFENIARSVVNALGQMAAQWVAYQAIQIATGQSAQAAATAGAAATGAGMAAAYAPAAALASLASFGANAVPAQAGLTATTALATSLAASSGFAGLFDKGGNIRAGQFGIVGERGPEIVNGPANITGRRDTARMMSSGTSGRAANDEGDGYKNVTINNYGSNEVVQSDDGNGGLTIDIVKSEFAKDMRTNGQMYQSLAQNTTVKRKGR